MSSFPNKRIALYNPTGSDPLREESMVDLIVNSFLLQIAARQSFHYVQDPFWTPREDGASLSAPASTTRRRPVQTERLNTRKATDRAPVAAGAARHWGSLAAATAAQAEPTVSRGAGHQQHNPRPPNMQTCLCGLFRSANHPQIAPDRRPSPQPLSPRACSLWLTAYPFGILMLSFIR